MFICEKRREQMDVKMKVSVCLLKIFRNIFLIERGVIIKLGIHRSLAKFSICCESGSKPSLLVEFSQSVHMNLFGDWIQI